MIYVLIISAPANLLGASFVESYSGLGSRRRTDYRSDTV